MSEPTRRPDGHLLRAIIGFALYLLLAPALLFISAGTVAWPMAWVYVSLLLVATLTSRVVVWRRNPDLLRERARFAQGEGTNPQDRLLVIIVGLGGPIVMMVVAGLDQRFGWTTAVPAAGQYLGAILTAAGYGLGVWAMISNPFFSAVVRIQQDRGQVVVTAGPYRFVRHPAYTGALISSLALPFQLDALWVLVPALILVVVLVWRTRLEDGLLMLELAGYEKYAERTRYRLLPGIW